MRVDQSVNKSSVYSCESHSPQYPRLPSIFISERSDDQHDKSRQAREHQGGVSDCHERSNIEHVLYIDNIKEKNKITPAKLG